MSLITRRSLLFGAGGALLGASGIAGYGVAGEPMATPLVTRYAVVPADWPEGLALRLAVIADIHACEPWMPAERVRSIALSANALDPDLILLLGDFNAGHRFVTGPVMPAAWADALSVLKAPLGTFAVLGNHDWWHGAVPGMHGGPEEVRRALAGIGIEVLENRAVALSKDGRRFWIAGLADQMAYRVGPHRTRGADDLSGTLKQVDDGAPIILLAHEPYVYRRIPARVALTLSGHTHGGQVNLPVIGAPWSPSPRYNYGHFSENGRDLIVSGGLGTSGVPIRIGSLPEILDVMLGQPSATS